MVLGLRTLAKGVRGGVCAVGGAVKAVAGVAVGGVGSVLSLAKAAVSGEKKAQAEAEGKHVATQEGIRRELLVAAVLLVPLAQAPQLLVPGVLGAAAAKVVQVAIQKGKKGKSLGAPEKEVTAPLEGATSGSAEGAQRLEVSSGAEVSQAIPARGLSVSEKGPAKGRSVQGEAVSLLRSLSDSAVDDCEDDGEGECADDEMVSELQALLEYSQVQEVLAGVEQGDKEQESEWRMGRDSDAGVMHPHECSEHDPQGLCCNCGTFTGTAQDLLVTLLVEVKSRRTCMPENWVLPILKYAAMRLDALRLRGLCVGRLCALDIMLNRFPIDGRPVSLDNVDLACKPYPVPRNALPLAVHAKSVKALGLTAAYLLGYLCSQEACKDVSPITDEILYAILRKDDRVHPITTAVELCGILAKHPGLQFRCLVVGVV